MDDDFYSLMSRYGVSVYNGMNGRGSENQRQGCSTSAVFLHLHKQERPLTEGPQLPLFILQSYCNTCQHATLFIQAGVGAPPNPHLGLELRLVLGDLLGPIHQTLEAA